MPRFDFAAFLQWLRKKPNAQRQMTLGEFLTKLEALPPNMLVTFEDGSPVGCVDSFVGFPDQMGFEVQDEPCTVRGLRFTLKSALGSYMDSYGYRPDYRGVLLRIDRNTLLWRHTYGTADGAKMIVDLQEIDGVAVVVTGLSTK